MKYSRAALSAVFAITSFTALAADYPPPKQGESGGSAATMLTPTFAGELFGPGQPLDASQPLQDLLATAPQRAM